MASTYTVTTTVEVLAGNEREAFRIVRHALDNSRFADVVIVAPMKVVKVVPEFEDVS